MQLSELVAVSAAVAQTASRNAKIERLAALLGRVRGEEAAIAVAFLSGTPRQGRFGIGPAALSVVLAQSSPARQRRLSLREADALLGRLAATTGVGSGPRRAHLLGELFARAVPAERDFLARLLLGELRQGALASLLTEAVAQAAAIPPAELRRAVMVAGDLPAVAERALTEGAEGVARYRLRLFQPVSPMLAQSADEVAEPLERLGQAAFEYKIDGARVQVHKAGGVVKVYSRRLNEVSEAVPEIIEAVGRLPADSLILDGETIALTADGRPLPFQVTMRRFGRRLEVERLRRALPLSPFFFDLLQLEGEDLIGRPAEARFAALRQALPEALLVPRRITGRVAEAEAFLQQALHAGHEGVMAKSLVAPYEAGSRGSGWLKLKPAQTLDLVVLAAEWGHGRRRGWLSNLHLGARDERSGRYVMLGKTFKGLTDAMLVWQTRRLLELEVARDAQTVYVRPELVVEVAFNEVQESRRYSGGVALRFARLKGYRPDKRPEAADTMTTVWGIQRRQHPSG